MLKVDEQKIVPGGLHHARDLDPTHTAYAHP
jgi:hypothetical protein